jgi:hypothetical protein
VRLECITLGTSNVKTRFNEDITNMVISKHRLQLDFHHSVLHALVYQYGLLAKDMKIQRFALQLPSYNLSEGTVTECDEMLDASTIDCTTSFSVLAPRRRIFISNSD